MKPDDIPSKSAVDALQRTNTELQAACHLWAAANDAKADRILQLEQQLRGLTRQVNRLKCRLARRSRDRPLRVVQANRPRSSS